MSGQPQKQDGGFIKKLARESGGSIHFVVCRDGKNRWCHYFLLSSPQKIKMLSSVKKGLVAMKDFGVIVASGLGREPKPSVLAMLRETYGFEFGSLQ